MTAHPIESEPFQLHLHRNWAHPRHHPAATSAPGLRSSRCHICTGTGRIPATSALGLGSPLQPPRCHIIPAPSAPGLAPRPPRPNSFGCARVASAGAPQEVDARREQLLRKQKQRGTPEKADGVTEAEAKAKPEGGADASLRIGIKISAGDGQVLAPAHVCAGTHPRLLRALTLIPATSARGLRHPTRPTAAVGPSLRRAGACPSAPCGCIGTVRHGRWLAS